MGVDKIKKDSPINDKVQYDRSSNLKAPIMRNRLRLILEKDLGRVSCQEGHYQFITQNLREPNMSKLHTLIMNLLGKVAEAVFVRQCAEDKKLNKKFFEIARGKKARWNTANQFQAIGTGLKSTMEQYRYRYNPSDTQRDIIWVNKNKWPALVRGSNGQVGIEAGLQIKVSTNGKSKIFHNLKDRKYEVPILYFPMSNDSDELAKMLARVSLLDPITNQCYSGFINAHIHAPLVYEEVFFYYPLIDGLLKKEIELDKLSDPATGEWWLQHPIVKKVLEEDENINKERFNCFLGEKSG